MLVSDMRYAGSGTRAAEPNEVGLWSDLSSFTRSVGETLSALGYRGWFDVDYIVDPSGCPCALEINARRTGPIVSLNLLARYREIGRPGIEAVASNDAFRLPARISAKEAFDIFWSASRTQGVAAIPTYFLGTDALLPTIGVAVGAADHLEALSGLNALGSEIQRLAWMGTRR